MFKRVMKIVLVMDKKSDVNKRYCVCPLYYHRIKIVVLKEKNFSSKFYLVCNMCVCTCCI